MSALGTITWSNNTWVLDTVPHITMRVKRIFPRAKQEHTRSVWIRDTPEVARDLEWLLERHPLDMDDTTRQRLADRANQHRDTEQTRFRILAGEQTLDLKEPARPARPYQLLAADLCHTTGELLLGDDVGLGKTFSSLLLLRDPDTLPALVVTLAHLPTQWQDEISKSLPWLTTHIAKTGSAVDVEADVIILNYAKLPGWANHLAGQVRSVIFDECHELRRTGTMKHDAARMIAGAANWRMGLSATPVYNYADEIHTIYQVLAPDQLGTRQEFLREWSGTETTGGKVKLHNPSALGSYLRDQGLLLRRTRADVNREIPDPIRILHHVDNDPEALDAVKDDITALARLVQSGTNTQKFTAAGEIDWKLRQATGIGKARYVAEFVRLLLESEDQVVLFGWHRAVYDIWLDYLAEYNPVLYTGTESVTKKRAAKNRFTQGDSRVLIMSLRSGAGLDGLQHHTSCVVFGELDWSPAMHDQCIGRVARDGQPDTVAAYFLVSGSGSDPVISSALELKRQQSEPIRNPDQPLLAPSTHDSAARVQALVDHILKETP